MRAIRYVEASMTFPIQITIHRDESGRYRAELTGVTIEASTLDELLDHLQRELAGAIEDSDFEDDLDYVLAKNPELYRRLGRLGFPAMGAGPLLDAESEI